jgi:hypothetical protein
LDAGNCPTIATAEYAAYLAASDYNLHELLDAGAPAARTFVMRPFNQIDQLAAVVPDLNILDRYRDGRNESLDGRQCSSKQGSRVVD